MKTGNLLTMNMYNLWCFPIPLLRQFLSFSITFFSESKAINLSLWLVLQKLPQVRNLFYGCTVLALVDFLFELLWKLYPICNSAIKLRYLQFRELHFLLFFYLRLHSFPLELKSQCHLSSFLSVFLAVLLFLSLFLLLPLVVFRRNTLCRPVNFRRCLFDLAVDYSIH